MRGIEIIVREEHGLWWAESDVVPGWSASADSPEELMSLAEEGLAWYLDEPVSVSWKKP